MRIVAGCYALACGGIENARLLLASTRGAANGVGNEHDLVGRFFMDHPFYWGGELVLARPESAATLEVLEGYEVAGRVQRAHAAFALTEAVRRAEGLNGAAVFFVRRAAHKTSAHVPLGGRRGAQPRRRRVAPPRAPGRAAGEKPEAARRPADRSGPVAGRAHRGCPGPPGRARRTLHLRGAAQPAQPGHA